MKSFTKIIALVASVVGSAFCAQANLVYNGSFELDLGSLTGKALEGPAENGLGVLDVGEWGVYNVIPGWKTVSGAGIELHRTQPPSTTVVSGVLAPHGEVYVELDSHPSPSNSAMAQSLTLGPGKYQLTFQYRPRTTTKNDNTIEASFAGHSVTLNGFAPAGWTASTSVFSYAGGTADLKFAALGFDNTLGGFIDNVSLVQVPDSGSTMAILGVSLIGFGLVRRRAS